MKPVTVCICLYQGEKYIEATLQSVVGQTSREFQLLIVDDGSTDKGVQLAKKFLDEQADFSWEIYPLPKNGGLAKARHFAEEYIQTPYIIFLDADDIMLPSMVDRLLKKITSDPDLMAVGCYLDYIDENGHKMKGGLYVGSKTKEEFYKKASNDKLIFLPSCAIFDRQAALRVGGRNITGFPEGKPYYQDMCEDCDLWTRMSDLYAEGRAIIVEPQVLCLYRKMDNTMSTNTMAMKLRMLHIKKNLKLRRAGKKELAFIEFNETITSDERDRIKRESTATDAFRKFGFAIIKKHPIQAIYWFLTAFVASPKYTFEKLKPFFFH